MNSLMLDIELLDLLLTTASHLIGLPSEQKEGPREPSEERKKENKVSVLIIGAGISGLGAA